MTAERIISGTAGAEEEAVERAIRPRRLEEYVGQARVKMQLEIFIGAARQRGEALDHVLIFGPPGLGKTTLAHIVAAELGVNLRQTSGPVLERPGDRAALRASPTGCSGACATTPRCAATAASTRASPTRLSTCSRWTARDSTRSTANSSPRSSSASTADRSASIVWPRRSARSAARSR